MTVTKLTIVAAGLLLVGLIVLTITKAHGLITPLATMAALAVLIGGGNLLYGKNSHGAKAQARIRPAQEAHNRAIDEARRTAQAATPAPAPAAADHPPTRPADPSR